MEEWLSKAFKSRYDELCWTNYPEFVAWARTVAASGKVTGDELSDLLVSYRDPQPVHPPEWPEEDGASAYIRDPPDPGPLAGFTNHGWIPDDSLPRLRMPDEELRFRVGMADIDVAHDVQENAIHILGRCNNPSNWGANRRGLVYGMVQSGKTANMIALLALARKAGYRLFVILAGDKSSLRDQTQRRFNRSFELRNGRNDPLRIHSPTYNCDFLDVDDDYAGNFLFHRRFNKKEEWSTIIVVKKQTHNLRTLLNQLQSLDAALKRDGLTFADSLPCLLLDDEADYATQNTNVGGGGNPIHNAIRELREVIPHNTYVGYTATPQACLSADPTDPVGYPKDFFWLLEPFQQKEEGIFRPKTYLGAYEVFWQYDAWLIQRIARDEWPHHEKDPKGKSLGVYVPPVPPEHPGTYADGAPLVRVETDFLENILRGKRPRPASVRDALLDFMIGCGIRWWREWKRLGGGLVPSSGQMGKSYPYHAAMVHLSLVQDNQELIRRLVQQQWRDAVAIRRSFDPRQSAVTHAFALRWARQVKATQQFFRPKITPSFDEVSPFIDACIEITSSPVYNHRSEPFQHYPGDPFVYLVNSTEEGAELNYDPDSAAEVQTKRAAIFVGGNILSRGLTIEGLSVSVFGRTAAMPMGDTTLQMGRWFGHKLADLDVVSVYVQDGVRETLKQVAEADRYLRLQIKDAILNGHSPTEVLVELRNSPFFRVTSPAKSTFLANDGGGYGFAGRTALLNQPSFDVDDILYNDELLERFKRGRMWAKVHERAHLSTGVPPDELIRFFEGLKCPEDASQTSFRQYAEYLSKWYRGIRLPRFPGVNVALWDRTIRRRREFSGTRPTTPEIARRTAEDRFGPIVGGPSDDKVYKGDAFLDKDLSWHKAAPPSPDKNRSLRDDILVVLYRVDPNYVTKRLWDDSAVTPDSPLGRWRDAEVRFLPGDRMYVGRTGHKDDQLTPILFAAWTPAGGPLYRISTNELIDVSTLKQRGREQLSAVLGEEELG